MAKINGVPRLPYRGRMSKESKVLLVVLFVNLVHLGLSLIQIFKPELLHNIIN